MTTFLSAKVQAVIRGISAIQGVEIFPKFRTKQSMLCIGKYGPIELRLIELITVKGTEVTISLDRFRALNDFRVAIGGPIKHFALTNKHAIRAEGLNLDFYTLPDGFYAPEFTEAFAGKSAVQNLAAVHSVGWQMTITSQQIQVFVPNDATDPEITNCVDKLLKLASHAPYVSR
jgi:hypothetical protein